MGSPLALFTSALVLGSSVTGTVGAARTSTSPPALALTPPALAAPEGDEGASPLAVGLVSAGMAGVVLGTGVVAWWDRGFTKLQWNDTGFFGKDTYAGGADKAGHAYSSYVSVKAMAPIYRALGSSRDASIVGATLFTFLLWNGFEVIDGFTSYGLEYGDVVANTLGIGLGALTELYPAVDGVVGLRLGYVPSRDFLERDKTMLKFVNDYSGMLFYLDLKAKGVCELAGVEPGLLRYLVGGVVWGTKDYSPVKRWDTRERRLGVHLGISLPEVLRAWGGGDRGVEGVARFFDFYALPYLSVMLVRELNDDRWIVGFGVANRAEVGL